MRAKKAKKRQLEVDQIYKSRTISRLINCIMLHGKKSIAESIVYTALEGLAEDKKEALKSFDLAIKNVMPQQEVRSRRVGGATYQVPVPLKFDRAEALALRWIVKSAREKKGVDMDKALLGELKDSMNSIGSSIKKRDDTHRMAEANRAFAHFARY